MTSIEVTNIKGYGRQAGLFCAVGFTNLFVDVAAYYSTYHFLHFNYLAAQAVSYPCGAINSYLLNRRLTFHTQNKINPMELLRFAVLNVFSILASMGALFLSNHVAELNLTQSKIIANGCAMCLNFGGSKWWVFRRRAEIVPMPIVDAVEVERPTFAKTSND